MNEIQLVVKILNYVLSLSRPVEYSHLSTALDERQETIMPILNRLVEKGILERCESTLRLSESSRSQEFCRKLFLVQDRLVKKRLELLVCGILSELGTGRLLRFSTLQYIVDKEGFSPESFKTLINNELSIEHIRLVRLLAVGEINPVRPLDMPFYYLSHYFRVTREDYQKTKERELKAGMSFTECLYVQGNYPPDLAEVSLKYVKDEKYEILSWLNAEILRQPHSFTNHPKCYWYFPDKAETLA